VTLMRWIRKNRRGDMEEPESADADRATRGIAMTRSIEEICNSFEAPEEFDTEEILGR
jgi:hypothetical protein